MIKFSFYLLEKMLDQSATSICQSKIFIDFRKEWVTDSINKFFEQKWCLRDGFSVYSRWFFKTSWQAAYVNEPQILKRNHKLGRHLRTNIFTIDDDVIKKTFYKISQEEGKILSNCCIKVNKVVAHAVA